MNSTFFFFFQLRYIVNILVSDIQCNDLIYVYVCKMITTIKSNQHPTPFQHHTQLQFFSYKNFQDPLFQLPSNMGYSIINFSHLYIISLSLIYLITEAYHLHGPCGPQWNEAPFPHCSHWLEKYVLLSFLPSLPHSPRPRRGFLPCFPKKLPALRSLSQTLLLGEPTPRQDCGLSIPHMPG